MTRTTPQGADGEHLREGAGRVRRARVRSRFDVRWLALFAFGALLSLAYYVAILWAAFRLLRPVLAWLHR